MDEILTQIVARKRERVAEARRRLPAEELFASLPTSIGGGRFVRALQRDRINIIAEIKRRSPSKGVIREKFDPVAIARNYTANGAAAISILTEEDFFDGALDHLSRVRNATDRPLLRKDFIFDEYQLFEAVLAGADAILLIAAMLEGPQLNDLMQTASALGLDALIEIHDRRELDQVTQYNVKLIGVNNRNLKTFVTSLETSIELAKDLPPSLTLVSESGIRRRDDIERLRAAGFHAFLIGEELMRAEDEGQALKALL